VIIHSIRFLITSAVSLMPNSNWAAIVADVTVSFALLYPGIEKLDLADGWFPTWKKLQVLAILAMFCFVDRVALLAGKALVALTTTFLIRPSATAQSVSLKPISRTRMSSCFFDPELALRI
jgi:hypothetical protein